MGYGPHEHLVAPARASARLRRLAAGCVAICVIFVLFSLVFSSFQSALWSPEFGAEFQTASTPASALVSLFFFGVLILSVWLTLWLFHSRSLLSLLGPLRPGLRQFRLSLLALVPIYAILMLLPAPADFEVSLNMAFGLWLLLLPLGLIGLLIQVAAEEFLFRGYLQSQLAARFSTPLIWIGVPSALFALLHYDTGLAGDHAWMVVLWAGAFAAAAADLTARAGTLGPAIGLHLVNNFSAILIAAPEGNFDGLALYSYPFTLADLDVMAALMPVEMMLLLCSWLAIRLALRC